MTVVTRTAIIDETGRYRYSLTRVWDADQARVGWTIVADLERFVEAL